MPGTLSRKTLTLDGPATVWRDPRTGRVNVSVADSQLDGEVRLAPRAGSRGDLALTALLDTNTSRASAADAAVELGVGGTTWLANEHGHFRFVLYRQVGHDPAVTVYAEPVQDNFALYDAAATATLHGTSVDWVEERVTPRGSRLPRPELLLAVSPPTAEHVMRTVQYVAETVFRDLPGWQRVVDYRVVDSLADRMVAAQRVWAKERSAQRRTR